MSLRRLSPLQLALLISLAVHGALLTLKITAPKTFDRLFEQAPLEVILVNAKSKQKPSKASALAQANLQGGGEAKAGRATSPLVNSTQTRTGDALEDQRQQLAHLEALQAQMLSDIRQQLATQPAIDPRLGQNDPSRLALEEKHRRLLQLLAEIEKRVNTENARPKKRFVSPATQESIYAVYYDQLRRKVERMGTEHFPQADGHKLYGELILTLTVNASGQLIHIELSSSSGQPVLDRQAVLIAKASAPFKPFSPEMRREADQIVVVSRFRFTRDETLETRVQTKGSP